MSCGAMGSSPADIRSILEGYCLDKEFIQTINLEFIEGESTITLPDAVDITVMAMSLIESEALPADTRIIDIEQNIITLNNMATLTGEYPATIVQYKMISDRWLITTRDYQIKPVVSRMTGLSFEGETRHTEYVSGTGSSILILSRKPIVEVHSINLITNPANWVFVSPSSVEPIKEEGLLKLKAVLEAWQNYVPAFPRGTRNIKVDYTFGFADVPNEICHAINMLTASQALAQIGARGGGGSLSVQGYSKGYGERGKYTDMRNELETWANAILRRYVMSMVGS